MDAKRTWSVAVVVMAWAAAGHPAPTAFETAVLGDAPALYYRFDEPSGDLANLGTLGAAYDGLVFGTLERGVASPGGDTAIGFNSAGDFIISAASAPAAFTGNPSFTAEAVFKAQNFAQLWAPLLHWGAGGTGQEAYFSFQNNNEDKLYAGFYNAGLRMTGTIPQDAWLHAVWVRQGGGNSSTGTTLYLNGVAVPLQADTDLPNNPLTPAVTTSPFHINRGSDFTRSFTGAIDEVALYGRALAASEVLEHYTAFLTGSAVGDYNASGQVEQGDLDLVLLNWGDPFSTLPAGWVSQRPTSGIVDQAELDAVLLNWGDSAEPSASNLPEPGVAGLLLVAALLGGVRPGGRGRGLPGGVVAYIRPAAACVAVLGIGGAGTPAMSNTWINPGTGDWFIGGNWSDGTEPDPSDVAFINNGGTAVEPGAGGLAQHLVLGSLTGQSGFVSVTTTLFPGELAISGTVFIGLAGTGGASVTLDSEFTASATVLGDVATGAGTLTVKDSGSLFRATDMTVGNAGQGVLSIQSGGRVWNTTGATLGNQAGGSGLATISGLTSHWDIEGPLVIGNAGAGEVSFAEGSLVVQKSTGLPQPVPQKITVGTQGALRLGLGANYFGNLVASDLEVHGTLQFNYTSPRTHNLPLSGTGNLVHDGGGSTILTDTDGFTGSIDVNAGLLRLDHTSVNLGGNSIRTVAGAFMDYEGATVRHAVLRGSGVHYVVPGATSRFISVSTQPSSLIFQDGLAEFDNATLRGTLLSNNALSFDGVWNTSSGVMEINSDLSTQDFSNDGVLAIHNGGTLNNSVSNLTAGGGSRTTIDAGGTMNLFGATTLELNGALLVNHGTITGTVNVNYGSLAKGTGAYDTVNVNEGGVYAPGTSPGIATAQAVTFDDTAFDTGKPVLQIELGGTTPGTTHDRLDVTGHLALGGVLDVVLIDQPGGGLFTPLAGHSFDILNWGTRTGTFAALQLPTLGAGLSWNTSQLYTAGVLSVAAALTGDYNASGQVEQGDLDLVLLNWGDDTATTGVPVGWVNDLPSGLIDQAELDGVLLNWGNTAEPNASNLPEPASGSLLLVVAGCHLRRRGWTREACRRW